MVTTSPASNGNGGSCQRANDRYSTPSTTNHFKIKPLTIRANDSPAE